MEIKKQNSYFLRIKEKLPIFLFNPDVLQYPKVTIPAIAEIMNVKSRSTVYRLLKDMRLDSNSLKNPDIKPLSKEEIGEYLVTHLTLKQGFSLYQWGIENRFDKKAKNHKRSGRKVVRGYGAAGPVARKRKTAQKTEADKQAEALRVKQALANSMIGGTQRTAITVDNSVNSKLKTAILNGDFRTDQATELARSLLGNGDTKNLDFTQQAYARIMVKSNDFNELQWSFEWLYKHELINSDAQTAVYRIVSGGTPTGQESPMVKQLVQMYKNNANSIDITKVGELVDY